MNDCVSLSLRFSITRDFSCSSFKALFCIWFSFIRPNVSIVLLIKRGLGFHLLIDQLGGVKMAQAVEEWYKQMPIITRSYLTAAIVITIGCSLDVSQPLSSLFFCPLECVCNIIQCWLKNFIFLIKMDMGNRLKCFTLFRSTSWLISDGMKAETFGNSFRKRSLTQFVNCR